MSSKLICKNCGGPIGDQIFKNNSGIYKCEYCNNVFTITTKKDDSLLTLLQMGEHELELCHFDDAIITFRKLIEKEPNEAESYFNLALAEFRVQYLKDEINNCLQPICHEITEKSFVKNKNYLKAISLASSDAKEEYIKKANEIDRINNEFYRLKEENINYDTFICVKVSDEDGRKTNDYSKACQIYWYLKEKGYNPFFSEFTLINEVGTDYEAHILYALYNAPSMLLICSDDEYLETKWVKNEYKRFNNFIENAEKNKNSIAILFKGNPIEKIPGKKGRIQGIDLDNISAIEIIEKFIKDNKEIINSDNVSIIFEDDEKINTDKKVDNLVTKTETTSKNYSSLFQRAGDILIFGSYYNKDDKTKEPLMWDILEEKDGKVLIVTHNIIDSKAFDTNNSNNYKKSSIRQWLNNDFYNNAFNELEKKILVSSIIDNSLESTGYDDNKYICENTDDKVFLLSIKEVDTYFDDAFSKKSIVTPYAENKNLCMDANMDANRNGWWWVRSPGSDDSHSGHGVSWSGHIGDGDVEHRSGVRPACWIKL